MKELLLFCEECRDDVKYNICEEEMVGVIKGVKYNYIGKVAYCTECGCELYSNELNDYNLKTLYDKYREYNGIISLEKILDICRKYNIGKRPLSLLLGWGEHTYSRYCEGDVPTKQYSNILEKIFENPTFYNEILEKNKKNLKSDFAYKKSKEAVTKLLFNENYKGSKINSAILYILNVCEDITPLALQKSLYYIQGFYYAFNNEFLFEEDCQAWIHGPVYPEVYYRYKDYRFDPIKCNDRIDYDLYSTFEIEVLENVARYLCCYSGKLLEEFTHSEKPWLIARAKLENIQPSNNTISKECIGEYFLDIKERLNMKKPSDIKLYSELKFKEFL